MKKLLALLFSTSLLWSIAGFADDISDFSIEGISIGDSLLDYMSENEILKEFEIGKNEYQWTDQKFTDVYIYEGITTYGYFSASVKRKDKKYIIYAARGMIDYEDVNVCFKKQKEISDQIHEMFSNVKKK